MSSKTNVRVTLPVLQIMNVLLRDVETPRYGLELIQETSLPSGVIYPVLWRLEASGWLRCTIEKGSPKRLGRPARKYYRLDRRRLATIKMAVADTRKRLGP